MKKKVLHLLSSEKFSGAENVVCQIIKIFKDEIEMAYCSPKGNIEATLKNENIEYIGLEKLNYKNLKEIIEKYKPDIIHAHDVKASVIASRFSNRCEIISHIHANHNSMNCFNLKTIIYAICSYKYKHIFWVSKSALEQYKFKKIIEKKSTVLYNVINKQNIIEKANKDNNTYCYDIIYLGRLTYQKNPERLVEIIKKVCNIEKDIKVCIVGTGDLEEKIREIIKEKNIEKNIDMLGFINNPAKILQSSKVMLMTSRYEGTPMCALEAMALGVPIVSTSTDGLIELIDNQKTGYILDNDRDIVQTLIKISKDSELRNMLSINSKKKFDEWNDINNYKKVLNETYNKGEI
jgi:glycosyltransferase involved in cell wall biosynthesis